MRSHLWHKETLSTSPDLPPLRIALPAPLCSVALDGYGSMNSEGRAPSPIGPAPPHDLERLCDARHLPRYLSRYRKARFKA
jgi:hypothetical protein